MHAVITRRDFINGMATAGLAAPACLHAQAAGVGAAGAEGDFGGQSLAAAAPLHARRDGAPLPDWAEFADTREQYDLVVVGAGISGLAAAQLYRQHAGRPVSMLILDAAPELGGHAQRNEFTARNGRRLIGYGGSESLDSPGLWSPAVHALVRSVGIELEQFKDYFDSGWQARHGLTQSAAWYAPELWGEGRLLRRAAGEPAADWVARTPLLPAAQRDLLRLLQQEARHDPWPQLTRAQKRARLAGISYDRFLTEVLGLHPQLTLLYRNRTSGYIGVGSDACSALDAFALGLPGFAGLQLGDAVDALMSPSGRQAKGGQDDYIYHFPDGNAGLVRALLRSLIPAALPGSGMESLVLAERDDTQLDRPQAPLRIRLDSPVLRVQHAPGGGAVDIGYRAGDGSLRRLRAGQLVLACFHRVIPLLCPELPAQQREALNDQVRIPLIYGNVLLSHWRPFQRAGIAGLGLPGHLFDSLRIDFPVSIGRYRFPDSPDEPILLHFGGVVLDGPAGAPEREQAAAGRRKLLGLGFAELEREIRSILQGALGPFGFDAAADIEAITINRWAHGYAYEYMRPWDTFWPAGPLPMQRARRGWGRIAIANSDAGAYAYAQGAIDQATRAVAELLPQARLPQFWRQPGPQHLKLRP
ncbi:NAD(P)-binding protein [Paucibacter soli]|uniref:NAD(P)-binding protein n=1 Tax=Paucibacter soli TaxID=3133433 RepID=UPI0030A9C8E2